MPRLAAMRLYIESGLAASLSHLPRKPSRSLCTDDISPRVPSADSVTIFPHDGLEPSNGFCSYQLPYDFARHDTAESVRLRPIVEITAAHHNLSVRQSRKDCTISCPAPSRMRATNRCRAGSIGSCALDTAAVMNSNEIAISNRLIMVIIIVLQSVAAGASSGVDAALPNRCRGPSRAEI